MAALEPIDPDRCQAEFKGGSFMTLGPRPMVRCERPALFIATERTASSGEQKGAMSLCAECADELAHRGTPPVDLWGKVT